MSNTNTDLAAELARLQAENTALKEKAAAKQHMSFKVSAKGAVSVYGLGRFPCTLYSQQMLRLLDKSDEIRAFIVENAAKLATKEA
jgi:hypothetical protein